MIYKALNERLVPSLSLPPAARAAGTANGTFFDKGRARCALIVGVTGNTANATAFKIEGRTKDPGTGALGAATFVKNETGTADLEFSIADANTTKYGMLYLGELPYSEYRLVAVTSAGTNDSAGMIIFGDFPEYPADGAVTNEWADDHGVAARAAAL